MQSRHAGMRARAYTTIQMNIRACMYKRFDLSIAKYNCLCLRVLPCAGKSASNGASYVRNGVDEDAGCKASIRAGHDCAGESWFRIRSENRNLGYTRQPPRSSSMSRSKSRPEPASTMPLYVFRAGSKMAELTNCGSCTIMTECQPTASIKDGSILVLVQTGWSVVRGVIEWRRADFEMDARFLRRDWKNRFGECQSDLLNRPVKAHRDHLRPRPTRRVIGKRKACAPGTRPRTRFNEPQVAIH